jgi:ABC-type glutathione transport system ATPase component
VLSLLRRIHDEGAALLLFTTRPEVAETVAGRVIRLEDGKLVDREGRPLDAVETGRTPGAATAPATGSPGGA